MKKKWKLLLLSVFMMTLFLSIDNSVYAAPAKEGDITWEVVKDTLYIRPVSGTKGKMKNYKSSQKKPWTNKSYTKIKIEKGVSEIGSYAFNNGKATRIEIAEGTKLINEGAFKNNKSLTYIRIPFSCYYLGHEAFAYSSTTKTNFVIDFKPRKMPTLGVNIFEGIEKSKTLRINVSSPAMQIGFMYSGELFKLERAAQFDIVEKTNLNSLYFHDRGFELYTGKPIYHILPMSDGLYKMTKGIDYTIKYINNTNPGTATIRLTGIGYYTGTRDITFKIVLPYEHKITASDNTSTSHLLKWRKYSALDGYELEQYQPATKTYKKIATLKKEITSYKVSKLKPSTSYTYRIRGYKTINKKKYYSSYSNTVKVTTKASSKLSTPTLKVTSTHLDAKMTWKKVSGASGYKIYYSTSKNGTYKGLKTISKGSITSYTKTNLTANKTYYFKIRAYKTANSKNIYSSYSTPIACKVKKISLKAPRLNASTKNKYVKMTWNKVANASGYQVTYATSKSGKHKLLKTVTKGNITTYTKTKLTKNKTYYFKVRAYRTVNGKKVYSSYSATKAIKVK